jgi:hypothetical protein
MRESGTQAVIRDMVEASRSGLMALFTKGTGKLTKPMEEED